MILGYTYKAWLDVILWLFMDDPVAICSVIGHKSHYRSFVDAKRDCETWNLKSCSQGTCPRVLNLYVLPVNWSEDFFFQASALVSESWRSWWLSCLLISQSILCISARVFSPHRFMLKKKLAEASVCSYWAGLVFQKSAGLVFHRFSNCNSRWYAQKSFHSCVFSPDVWDLFPEKKCIEFPLIMVLECPASSAFSLSEVFGLIAS